MGFGMGLVVAIWLIIVSAIVGALVAVVYNAFVAPKRT
jgi:ABC-type arginine/histidine transport system permease subunit